MELKAKKTTKKAKAVLKGIGKHNGKQLYKVLHLDGRPNQTQSRFKYSLPKNGKPGEWNSYKGSLVMCQRGLHLTTNPRLWVNGDGKQNRVFEAEYAGNMISSYYDSDKICCKNIRLLREVAIVKGPTGRREDLTFRPFTSAEKKAHLAALATKDIAAKLQTERDDAIDAAFKTQDRKYSAKRKAITKKIDDLRKKEKKLLRVLRAKERAITTKFDNITYELDRQISTLWAELGKKQDDAEKKLTVTFDAKAKKLGLQSVDAGLDVRVSPRKRKNGKSKR